MTINTPPPQDTPDDTARKTTQPDAAEISYRARPGLWLIAAAAVAGIILSGVAIAVMQPGFAVTQFVAIVERETGRKLSVEGESDIDIWPAPALALTKVKLSNPPDWPSGHVIEAERVVVSFGWTNLVARVLTPSSIEVFDATASLVTTRDGASNWLRSSSADKAGQAGEQAMLVDALPPTRFVNLQVDYLDERSGAAWSRPAITASLERSKTGDVNLSGSTRVSGERVAFSAYVKAPGRLRAAGSPVDVAITAPSGSLTANGFAKFTDQPEFAGRLEARGSDANAILDAIGVGGTSAGQLEFTVSGALEASSDQVSVGGLELTIGTSRLNGAAQIGLSGGKPTISADLATNRIELSSDTRSRSIVDQNSAWSTDAFNLGFLNWNNMAIVLTASELIYAGLTFDDVSSRFNLKDRELRVDIEQAAVAGGTLSGSVSVSGKSKVPEASAQLAVGGADAKALLGAATGLRVIDGRLDARVDVIMRGVSQAEMVSTSTGSAQVSVKDGRIERANLLALIGRALGGVQTGWFGQGGETDAAGTRVAALEGEFSIRDGIAETTNLALQSPGLKARVRGRVDLLSKRLDLKAEPAIVLGDEADGASATTRALPASIVIRGPWSKPRLYPDVAGITDNPDSAISRARASGELPGLDGAVLERLRQIGGERLRQLFQAQ